MMESGIASAIRMEMEPVALVWADEKPEAMGIAMCQPSPLLLGSSGRLFDGDGGSGEHESEQGRHMEKGSGRLMEPSQELPQQLFSVFSS